MLTNDRVDDDVLAAFIDGVLPAAERARAMRALAADPAQYAAFLEAAQIADILRGNETLRAATPQRGRIARLPFAFVLPVLAAAGIALTLSLLPSKAASDAVDLMQATTLLAVRGDSATQTQLPAGWDDAGWSVTRGGSAAPESDATALRVGARIAQLEFAVASGDSAAVGRITRELIVLISAFDGAGPVSAQLQRGVVRNKAERALAARQLRTLSLAPAAFDAGVWLATARFAAITGRRDFLTPRGDAKRALHSLVERINKDGPAQRWDGVMRYLRALEHADATDVSTMRPQIDSAIAAFPN